MPIYKPSELHQFLDQIGVSPKKRLSQNFLIDGNILKKIVTAASVTPQDLVLEVGPGPGSLTEQLLQTGAQVVAVEKDRLLAQALQRLCQSDRLQVHCADITHFDFEKALLCLLQPGHKAKLIANLPYHLTTPLLSLFIQQQHLFSTLTVMVQEEVARRLTALPNSSDYSSFTLFLNYYSYAKYLFKVSRHCFYPQPTVDSAMVHFELREPPPLSDRAAFFKVVRTAFEHRRKMLRGSLKELYPPPLVEKALAESHLNPQARPEQLSLQQFILFFESLQRL